MYYIIIFNNSIHSIRTTVVDSYYGYELMAINMYI